MRRMRVVATPVKGKDLQPGDLFSTSGPEYWDTVEHRVSIGEKVWLRTNMSAASANDSDLTVYRLEIIKEEHSDFLSMTDSQKEGHRRRGRIGPIQT